MSTTTGTSMWRKTRTSMSTGSTYSKSGSTSMAPTTKASSKHGGKTTIAGSLGGFSKAASLRAGSKAGSSTSSAFGTGDDGATVPSFWSLLMTRRMVRKFTSRNQNGRRHGGSDHTTRMAFQEPTYLMEPKKMFNSSQVEKVIGDVLEAHLHDFTYDAKRCNMLTRIIIEEIKDRVKALRFERYKIVCAVTMGEKRSQDLRVASRCVWDAKFDTYSTYNWENGSAFCSVTVFGIYHE